LKKIILVEYFKNNKNQVDKTHLVLSDYDQFKLNISDLENLKSLTTFQNEALLIESFKSFIEPRYIKRKNDSLDEYIYTLFRFYFFNEGYKLIPLDDFYIMNPTFARFKSNLRNETKTKKYPLKYLGNIEWAAIRDFINEIKFEKNHHLQANNDIVDLINRISIHHKSFVELEIDEKLTNIKNCNEFIIDKLGGPENIDYFKIFLDTFDSKIIRRYMNLLHAFRHFKENSIIERKNYSLNDKLFMLEAGIMIINHLYRSYKDKIIK